MQKRVFDPVRKKKVVLTPEEEVRQALIMELSTNYGYPLQLMSCEYSIDINRVKYRVDLVVFDKEGKPLLLVECKAPNIKISQQTFSQILLYNYAVKCPYLLLTNGKETILAKLDKGSHLFLTEIPNYNDIVK